MSREGEAMARLVAWLLRGEPGPEARDVGPNLLARVAHRARWDYLEMLCEAAADAFRPAGEPDPLADRPEVRARMLSYRLRLNAALSVRRDPESARPVAEVRVPARRSYLGADYWVSPASIEALLADVRVRAAGMAQDRRAAWMAREIRRLCRRLDDDLRRGVAGRLLSHFTANDLEAWRRLALACDRPAVHVRLHYSPTHMLGAVVVGARSWKWSWRLPGDSIQSLLWPRKTRMGYDYAARMISVVVHGTLVALNDASAPDEVVMAELKGCYDWTLGQLFDDRRVKAAIAALGPHPTLVVTTHGALAQLPFAALHDGTRFVGEMFDVVQSAPRYAVAGGNPILDRESVTGGRPIPPNARARVLVDTVGLGEGGREADFYDDELKGFLERRAWRAAPRWDEGTLDWLFAGAGVAVLSAHIHASPDHIDETHVQTPDMRLVSLAASLPPRTEVALAILAGCRSAAPVDWFGAEEHAIAARLRAAGVQSVVTTLWDVNDLAARLYNERMMAGIAAGLPRARAHGEALRHIQAGAAPNFWAPFVLSGAWR